VAGNSNYSTDVLTTTLEKYAKKGLTDNIFQSSALFNQLKKNWAACDGGVKIIEPLEYVKNTTAGSYSGYDALDTTPQTTFTAAEYDWKEYSVSVSISGLEETKNSGEAAVINLLKAKLNNASNSLIEDMNEDLFGDGTDNHSKALTGLDLAVDSSGTYGNIARGSNSWWQSTEDTTSESLTIDTMRTNYMTVSKGGKDSPTLIVTTQTLMEAYMGLVEPHLRLTDTKTADAGFMNYMFYKTPMVWDEQCSSGYMYMLNTNYLKLRYAPSYNFKTTPFRIPTNQDAKVAFVLFKGNLTCSNCARQAKLTGKTA
jgi:hypothetical protein